MSKKEGGDAARKSLDLLLSNGSGVHQRAEALLSLLKVIGDEGLALKLIHFTLVSEALLSSEGAFKTTVDTCAKLLTCEPPEEVVEQFESKTQAAKAGLDQASKFIADGCVSLFRRLMDSRAMIYERIGDDLKPYDQELAGQLFGSNDLEAAYVAAQKVADALERLIDGGAKELVLGRDEDSKPERTGPRPTDEAPTSKEVSFEDMLRK